MDGKANWYRRTSVGTIIGALICIVIRYKIQICHSLYYALIVTFLFLYVVLFNNLDIRLVFLSLSQ